MEERRKIWAHKLKNRDVVLFGAGAYAKQFYQEFHHVYSIVECVTNCKEETLFSPDEKTKLEIHRPDVLKERGNIFIVVCVRQSHDILEQLRAMGYRYGEDFLESDILRLMLSEKKIAVFYGVCYIRAIYTCLMESVQFKQEFDAMYWLDYMGMDAGQEQLFFLMLGLCDLFVCNAFISEQAQRRNGIYTERLSSKCRIISIPILIFNGYYPCRPGEIGKDNPYSVVSCTSPFAPFITPDREINRMLEEGINTKDILKRISDPGYYAHEFVVENYEKEMRKLEMAEALANISICDFLYERHGRERTFLNEKHISNIVVRELAQRILEKLEMTKDIPESVCAMRLLYTSEVPVYPAVIEALGLDAYRGTTRLFTFQGDRVLSFEEYVEVYADYCCSMKKYLELGFFKREV